MERNAGVLCPLFSTPGNQGIGDLGAKTLKFIDCIADAGFKIWQILPIQRSGSTHSPYLVFPEIPYILILIVYVKWVY